MTYLSDKPIVVRSLGGVGEDEEGDNEANGDNIEHEY